MKKVRQRQISYDIAYMQNLKINGINELIHKAEIESQTRKLWLPGMKGEGINWETGTDIHTLLYTK